MNEATILVLGGYGRAGRTIARLLLQSTSVRKVIIAGRRVEKAQQQSDTLAAEFGWARVAPLAVDADNVAGLRQAFAGVDLVIVCLTFRGKQAQNVLHVVLDRGIHYIDLTPDGEKQALIDSLSDKLAARGCLVLTEAGIIPGCPAVLVRLAAGTLDQVNHVTLGSLYRDRDLAYDAAYDIIAHAGQQPNVVYEAGRWREVSALAARRVFFGERFGWRLALPVYLNELQLLPQALNIDRVCLYQGGMNPVADGLLVFWQLLRVLPSGRLTRPFTRLFLWSQRFTRPPFGVVQRMVAEGVVNGRNHQLTITLTQRDMYLATAVPVVAATIQMLNGIITMTGPQLMGHAVEPQRFVNDIEQLGMDVSIV